MGDLNFLEKKFFVLDGEDIIGLGRYVINVGKFLMVFFGMGFLGFRFVWLKGLLIGFGLEMDGDIDLMIKIDIDGGRERLVLLLGVKVGMKGLLFIVLLRRGEVYMM